MHRCEKCFAFELLGSEEKELRKDEHEQHTRRRDRARILMEKDQNEAIEKSHVCSINFDLQKVLPTPRAEVGPFYFLSKLSIWNFTIFNLENKQGICHVWNETVGARGSNEIASFLWKFLREASLKGKTDFYLYSDNCGGQNRNKNVFSMLIKAALEFRIFITQRYCNIFYKFYQ